ncbi:hypothetical protein [Candidatus Flexifilum breve]
MIEDAAQAHGAELGGLGRARGACRVARASIPAEISARMACGRSLHQ